MPARKAVCTVRWPRKSCLRPGPPPPRSARRLSASSIMSQAATDAAPRCIPNVSRTTEGFRFVVGAPAGLIANALDSRRNPHRRCSSSARSIGRSEIGVAPSATSAPGPGLMRIRRQRNRRRSRGERRHNASLESPCGGGSPSSTCPDEATRRRVRIRPSAGPRTPDSVANPSLSVNQVPNLQGGVWLPTRSARWRAGPQPAQRITSPPVRPP